MMRKFGTLEVLSAAVGTIPARHPQQRTAHRAVFTFVPREGFLYVRSRAISSRCNDNWDYFGPDEIAKSYQTFVGKPVFVNHVNSDHRQARGMVVQAALHRDRNPDGSPDTWVECLMEVDARTYPKLAKSILRGDIDRTSMGCDVEISKCSYCGNEATTPLEYCQHIPGKKGKRIYRLAENGKREGVLVFEICSGLSFFENSLLVEPPADPTAYFLGQPVMGPGLEHLAKSARLAEVISEHSARPVASNVAPMQRTANLHQPASTPGWTTIGYLDEPVLPPPIPARTAGQAEAEAYLSEHPIGVHHILNRVNQAAQDPHTLHSGMRWYDDAHGMAKTMASHHGVPLHHAAGALGVYSASSAPAPNFHMASMALHAGRGIWAKDRGDDEGGHGYRGAPMASQVDADKVSRILGGEHFENVINSSKTKNYARLIHNPDNDHDVVIDRHAVAAAVGHDGNSGEPYNAVAGAIENANKKGGGKIYDRVGDAYREATHQLNNAPEHQGLRDHMRRSGLLGADEQIKPHHTQALAWIAQKDISDQNARNNMSSANQKNIDAWQNHYTSRYGADAHHPVSGKGFYGQEPTRPDTSPKAASFMRTAFLQALGYGETLAPQDVDTLRDERCAICGNDTAYDGRECLVCGYLAPPKALADPDIDKAKRLDELKQSVDDALLDVDPSRNGADFDPGDTDAIQAHDVEDTGPSLLGCPRCGSEFPSALPTTEDAIPGQEQDGPAEGDVCPECGKGILAPTAEPEPVGDGLDEDGEPGDEQDALEDQAEGGLPGEQDPNDPDASDPEDPDAEEVDEDEDDDEQDDPDEDDDEDEGPIPVRRKSSAKKYRHPSRETEMQKTLIAIAQLQDMIEYQQRENLKLTRRMAAKDSQIQRLTAGMAVIARALGPEMDKMVRTAMLNKTADEQNPAQPIPEPAPEPPTESTVQAETPEAMANVMAPGLVPGSTQDVAADAVSTVYTPGQDIAAAPLRELVDVTRPIEGTQGPRPLSETKTNVDVRVGNPMNPQTAFPLGPAFPAQRTSSVNGGGQDPNENAKFMNGMRLARLRIAAGTEDGEDLVIAQKIASSMDMTAINAEIATLGQVIKAQASRGPQAGAQGPQRPAQAPPRGAVPRPTNGVARTITPLTANAGLRTTSSARDEDSDLALLFLSDSALSD